MYYEQDLHSQKSIWLDNSALNDIRKLFAPTLSDTEFKQFVDIGKSNNLNPYLRQICVNKNTSEITITLDGYRKLVQVIEDYEYHQCDSVYSNDDFEVSEEGITQRYNLKDRGELLGAWSIVKLRSMDKPFYKWISFQDASTGQGLWKPAEEGGKPDTMIKKEAELQCLKAFYHEYLGKSLLDS